jgi:hypothetical protein
VYEVPLITFRLGHTSEVLLNVHVSAQTHLQEGIWFTVHENVSLIEIGQYIDDV